MQPCQHTAQSGWCADELHAVGWVCGSEVEHRHCRLVSRANALQDAARQPRPRWLRPPHHWLHPALPLRLLSGVWCEAAEEGEGVAGVTGRMCWRHGSRPMPPCMGLPASRAEGKPGMR